MSDGHASILDSVAAPHEVQTASKVDADGHGVPVPTCSILADAAAGLDRFRLRDDVCRELIATMPELGDPEVRATLRASVEENISAAVHILEHGPPSGRIDAPNAALENARRLAQRDISVAVLLRCYRLGHIRFMQACLEEVQKRVSDVETVVELTRAMVTASFHYIDDVSIHVESAHRAETEQWPITVANARVAAVRNILAGESIDIINVENSLGYELRQSHLAVICTVRRSGNERCPITVVRDAVDRAAACLQISQPLILFQDEKTAWVWFGISAARMLTSKDVGRAFGHDANLRISVGELATGVDGFRATIRQAQDAQKVSAAGSMGATVTHYADVATLAILCNDDDGLRRWVWSTLGDLCFDDENSSRLRETLMTYLVTRSYRVTAERLTLHRNTVQYRIRRAEELLKTPLDGVRADVELALRACHFLGQSVLREHNERIRVATVDYSPA